MCFPCLDAFLTAKYQYTAKKVVTQLKNTSLLLKRLINFFHVVYQEKNPQILIYFLKHEDLLLSSHQH